MLRPHFLHHRELLGGLVRAARETVLELMRAAVGDEPFIDVAELVWDVRVDAAVVSVRDLGPPYDPQGAVLEWLRSHPGWNTPAAVKNSLRLDRSTWNRVIRTLLDVGQIERTGEKRGTKYRAIEPDRCPNRIGATLCKHRNVRR